MNNIENLLSVVPSGTAEGERALIERVFVEQDDFAELAVPAPYSPILLVGKKGSGKTAFLDALSLFVLQHGIPVAKINPSDLKLSSENDDGSVAFHIRDAYAELVRVVASKMALQLKGLVTSDEDKVLLSQGLTSGAVREDTIARLARILPMLAQPFTGYEIDTQLLQETDRPIAAIREAIAEKLSKSGNVFYLLFDDTDQVSNPNNADHLNRIWGILLAARKLAQDSAHLRVIVTLREEVWRRLSRSSAGQRDQVDHFDQLIKRLSPTKAHLKAIVLKRLQEAALKTGLPYTEDPWRYFFENDRVRMPSSSEYSSWMDIVVSRSRERPRDAIQLIAGLARRANSDHRDLINQSDLDSEMPVFSTKRVEYLVHEAELECPQIQKVVESLSKIPFDQGSFKCSFEVIRDFLRGLPNEFGIQIYGRTIHASDDDDFLVLLGLLFDLGVLNARVSDKRESDEYRHVRPDESPALVSRSHWNDLQKIVWEVHPAYRDYMIQLQRDAEARAGLAGKKRR